MYNIIDQASFSAFQSPFPSKVFFKLITRQGLGMSGDNKVYVQLGRDDKIISTHLLTSNLDHPDRIIPMIKIRRDASSNAVRFRMTLMSSTSNTKWRDNTYYYFDGNSLPDSGLNDYFKNNNAITTRKITFRKTHTNTNSISIISGPRAATLIAFHYELFGTSNDLYYGIKTTNSTSDTNWVYSDQFTPLSEFIAYVNLRTGQGMVGLTPFTLETRTQKVLLANFSKTSTFVTTFTAFNHLVAPSITTAITTSTHTGSNYLHVFTCQNVIDNNLIVFHNFLAKL